MARSSIPPDPFSFLSSLLTCHFLSPAFLSFSLLLPFPSPLSSSPAPSFPLFFIPLSASPPASPPRCHSLVKFAAITCWITSPPPPLVLSYARCGTSPFGRLLDFRPRRYPAAVFVSLLVNEALLLTSIHLRFLHLPPIQ